MQLALVPENDPEPVQRSRERQGRPALGEDRTCLVERGLGVDEPALDRGLPAGRAQDPAPRRRAAARPGELDRERERLVGALGLEAGVVDVVQLEQHPALEVGAPDPLRDREPLVRKPHDLLEVALPVR